MSYYRDAYVRGNFLTNLRSQQLGINTMFLSQVKTMLKEGGGKKEYYVSDLVTHVITENTMEEEFRDKLTVISLISLISYLINNF